MLTPKNSAEYMHEGVGADIHPEVSSHLVSYDLMKASEVAKGQAISRIDTANFLGEDAVGRLVSSGLEYSKSDLSPEELAAGRAQVLGASITYMREQASGQDVALPPVA